MMYSLIKQLKLCTSWTRSHLFFRDILYYILILKVDTCLSLLGELRE